MFEPTYIISINLNSKKYDEAIALERDLIEDISKECDPRYKIKTYLHAKTFDTKFKIPTAEKNLIDKLNSKRCVFITPNIKDFDVVTHLLAYIKRWKNRADTEKFGRNISVIVDSKDFGDGLFLTRDKFLPSMTRLSIGNIPQSLVNQIEDFNKAIDEVPVYIKKEGDEEEVVEKPKTAQQKMVEKFLKDFPIK